VPIPLTDETISSSYSVSFSPEAEFYLLNYNGPAVPWQRIVDVGNNGNFISKFTIITSTSAYIFIPDFDYVLTDNAALNTTLAEFESAAVTYSTIDSDGFG
jgi:dipeptidyl aminopeptidase